MRQLDENTALSILFGNTKRKKRQVNLIKIAKSCKYLVDLYGSKAAVAARLGIHSEMIRQFISLLTLPEEVKNLITDRKIDRLDVAYRIAMLKNQDQQIAVAKHAANLPSSKDIRDILRIVNKGGVSVEESTRRVLEAKPKGLHIFIMDFDDKTYNSIHQRAKNLKIEAAQLVKQIVEEWLSQQSKETVK
jgi:hypothetical protein